MIILCFWIGLAIGVGLLADRYGRGPIAWFVLAALISPLLAGVFLLIAGKTLERKAAEEMLLEDMKTRRRRDALMKDVTARARELAEQ